MNVERIEQRLASKMQWFTLLNKYLLSFLTNRARSNDWYENRVLRYILKGSPWIQDLETTFQQADLGSIPNSSEIFSVLKGTEADYDEQLFDALAEVRMVAWAIRQGYTSIEKLQANAGHPTPDFGMERDSKVFLAEVKHFRVRDYLVYFVADRLEGLALKTGALKQFGLSVKTGGKYQEKRDNILKNRADWRAKARLALTQGEFLSLVQNLGTDEDAQIMDGLFLIQRSNSPDRVYPALTGRLDPMGTANWCLPRLRDELRGKLRQIKEFMDATGTQADRAIVFFSGVDEWEPEWTVLWETLEGRENCAWELVQSIKQDADKLIGIPFELIIGRYQKKGRGPSGEVEYGPIEYVPFPWQPEGMSS